MAGESITQMGLHGTETELAEPGAAVRPLTLSLLEPVYRLVSLVRTPQDIPVLHEVFHREILSRLLTHPIGDRLRRIVQHGSQANRIVKAVSWLRQNYSKHISVHELAEVAGMAASTLHRHLREVTTLSPLQYQKKLRLQEARHLMLVDGLDTITTAYTVRYESVTQFNREYRRLIGQPPARDKKALRESTGLGRAVHIVG
jgi:transcriptional regulator GlxA family with amidase domain